MVTIVIKDNTVPKEDILAYIEREHIEGEYEVITREEYLKRKAAEPVFEFQLSPSYRIVSYRMTNIEGEMLERERKQRNYQKQQQKYARRFYGKRR